MGETIWSRMSYLYRRERSEEVLEDAYGPRKYKRESVPSTSSTLGTGPRQVFYVKDIDFVSNRPSNIRYKMCVVKADSRIKTLLFPPFKYPTGMAAPLNLAEWYTHMPHSPSLSSMWDTNSSSDPGYIHTMSPVCRSPIRYSTPRCTKTMQMPSRR